jgi:hypothetical protein
MPVKKPIPGIKAAVMALQEAVDEELERKAKLGYSAVVLRNGRACVIPAAQILAERKAAGKKRAPKKAAVKAPARRGRAD